MKNLLQVFERKSSRLCYFFPADDSVEAGWVGRDAILMTGINALCYVASTIPP